MTRRLVQPTITLLVLLALSPGVYPTFAQDAPQTEVENSRFKVIGAINSNAVFIRSGPSENDYATTKLDKGVEVTVVGERFNWLKIVPPPGSFCYVAKAFVNRAGNGSTGQVNTTLNVRIGSDLNPLKTKVASKLEPGQRVEIIGEQDEYFKIKPPEDVYLYVSKQYVDVVRRADAPVVAETRTPTAAPETIEQSQEPTTPQTTEAAPIETAVAEGATDTAPAAEPGEATASTPPATQPVAELEQQFDALEAQYGEISQKPLDEQPVEELLAGYEKLAASNGLPESLRRICDFKVGVLKTRAEMKQQFAEVRRVQEDMKQKQMALRSEQKELEEIVAKADVQFFTAVGTLRTSSLQRGAVPMFRLTDPANGRTVVYVRSDDAKLGQMLGQFIGVKGAVADDGQLNLRVVTLESFETVNPTKVGQNVAAQIVPPSLLPSATANIEQ